MSNELKLTQYEERLRRLLESMQPGIYIDTLEESRCMRAVLRSACALTKKGHMRHVRTVSQCTHRRYLLTNVKEPEQCDKHPLFKIINDWMNEKMEVKDNSGKPKEVPAHGILVLFDLGRAIEKEANVARLLRETFQKIRDQSLKKTIIIMDHGWTVPDVFRPDILPLRFALPTAEELGRMVSDYCRDFREYDAFKHVDPGEENCAAIGRACTGLTINEASGLLAMSIVEYQTIDERTIELCQKSKTKAVVKGRMFETRNPKHSLDDVGGLEKIKEWALDEFSIMSRLQEAIDFGCEPPRGIILAGVPGCGKSYMADALAATWKRPIMRYNVGATFGKLVGATEENFARATEMAKSLAPCILYIDEIEKALGADDLNSGVTERLKGELLTWLEEKDPRIFVIATANDVGKFAKMPELLRRFDKTFFVDLPYKDARRDIFEAHLRKYNHAGAEVSDTVIEATRNYSGSEIRDIVQAAIKATFKAGLEHPSQEIWLEAVRGKTPLYKSMQESIERYRDWAKEGRAQPAGKTIEDELADELGERDTSAGSALAESLSDLAKQ